MSQKNNHCGRGNHVAAVHVIGFRCHGHGGKRGMLLGLIGTASGMVRKLRLPAPAVSATPAFSLAQGFQPIAVVAKD